MRSKRLAAAIGTGLAVSMGSTAAFAQAPSMKSITIGSNPAGSAYYLLAGGFAKTLQQELKVRTTAQPHSGSSVYLPLLERGEITLGLNSSLDSAMARDAAPPYSNKHMKVRVISRFFVLPYAYIVKGSSDIKSMDDLKGKKVLINTKTNVSLANANRALLATAGLDEKTVQALDSGGVVAGLNAVVEGRADSATVSVGMPQLLKAHASSPGGIRVLPLGKQGTDSFLGSKVKGLFTITLQPAKRYPMISQPTLVSAFDSYINAGSSVTDNDAYLIAKALHRNWEGMQKDYAPLRGLKASEVAPPTTVMPYHPGAIRYYKEAGLWTAAHDKNEAQFK